MSKGSPIYSAADTFVASTSPASCPITSNKPFSVLVDVTTASSISAAGTSSLLVVSIVGMLQQLLLSLRGISSAISFFVPASFSIYLHTVPPYTSKY